MRRRNRDCCNRHIDDRWLHRKFPFADYNTIQCLIMLFHKADPVKAQLANLGESLRVGVELRFTG